MSSLIQRIRGGRTGTRDPVPGGGLWPTIPFSMLPEWFGQFGYNGIGYGGPQIIQTMQQNREKISADFTGYINGAYKSNGAIFACILTRMLLFSEARFQFRTMTRGRPGKLFGTQELLLLETPWQNATTGDLLARMETDVSLAGNFYATTLPSRDTPSGRRIVRLRPDWVTIVLGSMHDTPNLTAYDPSAELVGYMYEPGGPGSGREPKFFQPEQVCHYAPIPDPMAHYRGMSWIEPILMEVLGDRSMNTHKLMYFENGASPNLVVSMDTGRMDRKTFKEWTDLFDNEHSGSRNAYKTLYLGLGASATVVGSNLKDLDYAINQGHGEPLALDTPIPTPTGWTTMGEVQVGDEVFGRHGRPIKVLETHPIRTQRPCYRVAFSDGTSIVADATHIWTAMDRSSAKRAERSYTTLELHGLIEEWKARGVGGNRIGIPAGRPVELQRVDLLIDPYVLGVWLGDGQTAGAAICGVDPDLEFIQNEFERRGYSTRRWSTSPDKCPVFGVPGGLLAALDALGVLGCKHIPDEYLRASHEQRLDLLRGLMDTDGTIGQVGNETCEYSSKWEHLARQVAELTRSLGYRSSLNYKADHRSRTGGTWRLTFRADPDVLPFLLPRKADRCQTPVHVKNRSIVSIEPVDSVPVRCITVDSSDHLFRAGEGWTLTHNTRIAAAARVPPIIVGFSEGLDAATYSCPYEQSVWTPKGPRPLGELRIGDEVWTSIDGQLARKRVSWQGKTGEKCVYTIKTKNRTFKATGNHPVLMPDGSYKLVEELTTADRILAPLGLPDLAGDRMPDGALATEEKMLWLGAYTGDGCLSGDGGVRMCIPSQDRVRTHYERIPPRLFTKSLNGSYEAPGRRARDGLTSKMVELHGRGLTFREIRDHMGLDLHPMSIRDRVRTATRVYRGAREPVKIANARNCFRFESRQAVEWHREMGVLGTAKTKRVPGWIFGLREGLRLAFLAGVVDTDGSVDRRGALRIQQSNHSLVEDLRMLAVSCGIQCSNIGEVRARASGLPNPGLSDEYLAWTFTASSAVDVARVPFVDPVYRERVAVNQHRQRVNGSGVYKITSIERGTEVVPVYDIEVEGGGHTFLADGVVVHNSNYGQARRAFADATLRPMWRNAAGSLATLLNIPPGSDLWYDDRDIPFLQADEADGADIQLTKATAIRLLVDSGYDPDSVIEAIEGDDFTLLKHSGLYSVQLQAPSTSLTPAIGSGWEPNGDAPPSPTNGSTNGSTQLPQNSPNGSSGQVPSKGRLASPSKRATMLGNVGNVEALAKALIEARKDDKSTLR